MGGAGQGGETLVDSEEENKMIFSLKGLLILLLLK